MTYQRVDGRVRALPPLRRTIDLAAAIALSLAAAIIIIFGTGRVAAQSPARPAASVTIELVRPWARATPPGAKVAGGFVEIANHGPEEDRLIAATSEIAGRVEIHETVIEGSVAKMRPLAGGIAVPAGGTVALKPGSYHLMMMELRRPLAKGDSFEATLTFAKAGTMTVRFDVAGIGAPGPAEHAH